MKRLKAINVNHIFRLFWIIIIASFIIWCIFLVNNPQGYQLNLFFDRMHNFLADATNVTEMIRYMNPYFGEAKGSYPPLAYLLFYPLMRMSAIPEAIYSHGATYYLHYHQPSWLLLYTLCVLILILILYAITIKQFVDYPCFDAVMMGGALCFSYPMLYTLERGNILIASVVATSIFVFYSESSCKWKKEISLLSLAFAIGLKVTPAVFIILLICNRDWKAVFRIICYSILFIIGPFSFFEHGIYNLPQMFSNMNMFLSGYVGGANVAGTGLVASYLKFAKILFGEEYRFGFATYLLLMILKYELSLFLILAVFQFTEKWKIVLNLTLVLLIFPKVSIFYCVLYMIPFTVLYLNYLKNEPKMSMENLYIIFCLLMFYFVYRCPISNFLDYNFAIPCLTFFSIRYSLKAFIISKQILPPHLFFSKKIKEQSK